MFLCMGMLMDRGLSVWVALYGGGLLGVFEVPFEGRFLRGFLGVVASFFRRSFHGV